MKVSIAKAIVTIAALTFLTACSNSGDSSSNVSAACDAFEESGPQTIDTIEPFLDEMVNQAEQAAAADNSLQEFANAAVVIRDSLVNVGEGSEEDIIARQDMMLKEIEVFEGYCSNVS